MVQPFHNLPLQDTVFKGYYKTVASRHSIKTNVIDGYYHVYNRGVGKRRIFKDKQDYLVFTNYLKEYLSPPFDPSTITVDVHFKDTVFKGVPRQPKNYYKKVELLVYCLMPNHFHLLLKQLSDNSMKEFLHSLCLRYSMYFNKKYRRVGPLFQGRFRGIQVLDDSYLLHLSRYIHLNPSDNFKRLENAYSSYAEYLNKRNTKWIHTQDVIKHFNKKVLPEYRKFNNYEKFVTGYNNNELIALEIGGLTLE